jgi:hypothetical protein
MTTPEISVPAISGLWKVDTIVTIVDTLGHNNANLRSQQGLW